MRIAVVITCYRNEATIAAAVASVLAQSRSPDEVVVVDDASPGSVVLDTALAEAPVRVLRRVHNGGAGAARQTGTDATSAEWLAYLDGDDIWHRDKLAQQLAFAELHPDCAAVHCALTEFGGGNGERVFDAKPALLALPDLLGVNHLLPSALLLRRSALEAIGGWSSDRRLVEDHDLVIRLVDAGFSVRFLAEPLLWFRRGQPSNLSTQRWQQMQRNLALVKHHAGIFKRIAGRRGLAAAYGRAIAELGRDPGWLGRAGRSVGWLLGYRAR